MQIGMYHKKGPTYLNKKVLVQISFANKKKSTDNPKSKEIKNLTDIQDL